LTSDVVGEIEKEGNVLVVRRIRVVYHLRITPEKRDVAVRVHGFHANNCPMARSIRDCVDITTSLELEDANEGEGDDA
jgi:organic hydroperoxide reductase OsmC/OhrA